MEQITVVIGRVEKTCDAVLTKSKFAALVDRVPGTVTHWIKRGMITGPALMGHGRKAKVVVLEALAQLATTLDWSQQLSQATPITPQLPASDTLPPDGGEVETAQVRLANARASEAEADAQLKTLKLMRETGQWLHVAEVERATMTMVADLAGELDKAPKTIAEHLATEFDIDEKLTALAIKAKISEIRQRWVRAHNPKPAAGKIQQAAE